MLARSLTFSLSLFFVAPAFAQLKDAAGSKDHSTIKRVQATRLKAAGAGPLAPVAPNETDPGRAKNRRVELVKQ